MLTLVSHRRLLCLSSETRIMWCCLGRAPELTSEEAANINNVWGSPMISDGQWAGSSSSTASKRNQEVRNFGLPSEYLFVSTYAGSIFTPSPFSFFWTADVHQPVLPVPVPNRGKHYHLPSRVRVSACGSSRERHGVHDLRLVLPHDLLLTSQDLSPAL